MAYSTTAPVTRVANPRAGRVQLAARRVHARRVQLAASRFSSSYARNVIVRAGDATSTGMVARPEFLPHPITTWFRGVSTC